eukprot:TRINITY_DN110831_c0_g1_i1.p1 TRINITY_DN110831_c0_g1~~TRINITY_DN110831_c0_g1_i1.p1  ORF type:complete len:239 (+),score=43.55 TRINITY_DN110831_c0_g1_i1:35-751(+)
MAWSCCVCDCQGSSPEAVKTEKTENWKVSQVDAPPVTPPQETPEETCDDVVSLRKLEVFQEEKDGDRLQEARPREYKVELEWTETRSSGIVFDLSDSRIPVVLSIEPGSDFENWNAKFPELEVETGHGLMSVNDEVLSGAEMVAKLKGAGHVSLMFKLPLIRTVKLSKKGRPLGFFLARTGTSLVVESVTSGGTAALAGIKESDRIVAVNDREGGPLDLNDMIRKCEELEVRLASYVD